MHSCIMRANVVHCPQCIVYLGSFDNAATNVSLKNTFEVLSCSLSFFQLCQVSFQTKLFQTFFYKMSLKYILPFKGSLNAIILTVLSKVSYI
uniref:Uncharacterized protein n=1 Tax=Oryza nivara TaxID=4536 RepID=A0A0E0I3M8_ORYNI